MKKRVKVDLSWRAWSLIVGFFILIGFIGLGFAYNSGVSPSVMGHSAGEIEGVCLSNGTNCLMASSTSVVNFSSSCSGSFSVPSSGNYLVFSKADVYTGDSNIYVYFKIDGAEVDRAYVGDSVAEGGYGGGRSQASFISYLLLSSGSHTFSIEGLDSNCKVLVLKI